ncbi:MAG: hypothetical protein EPN21_19505 [Methylococcaceae bacterium]|nr:MAG: hypothetical protein EPN21_19505 [Methylococcaceae bacterium]
MQGGTGNDALWGDADKDSLDGGAGNDTLLGGEGSDTLYGSEGDDQMFGDAGNDLFVFGDISGHATVDGGSGNWTDVIEIDMADGPAGSAAGGNWTLEIEDHKIVDGHDHGAVDVNGAEGTIHTEHGDINFDNIDKIEW